VEIRVIHGLGADEALRRLRAEALRHELELALEEDGRSGRMQRATPLGAVHASWRVLDQEVVVRIERKPAFLPDSTVRRFLEEGLRGALGRG
jgi:hypothetical protein